MGAVWQPASLRESSERVKGRQSGNSIQSFQTAPRWGTVHIEEKKAKILGSDPLQAWNSALFLPEGFYRIFCRFSVACHQGNFFRNGLGDQQPVKGISMDQGQLPIDGKVILSYRKHLVSEIFNPLKKAFSHTELADRYLDRHLPKRRVADENPVLFIGDHSVCFSGEFLGIGGRPNQGTGIEEE